MTGGIGNALRSAREARGLGLERVEADLKIRRRFLEALEDEHWERLPAPSYARGFLRTYANYLDLDAEALVARYRELHDEERYAAAHHSGVVEPWQLRPAESERRRHSVRGGSPQGPPRPARAPGSRWRGLLAATTATLSVFLLVAIAAALLGDDPVRPAREPAATEQPERTQQTESGSEGSESGSLPSRPARTRVRLLPTGAVWACVVDERGEALVDGVTFTGEEGASTLRGRRLEMNFGNGQLELEVNGEAVPLEGASDPVGFRATPSGVRELPEGQRPSCS